MRPSIQNCGHIEILLATCNGADFLEGQLESLFSQTCQDFIVRVRDDYSIDNTAAILSFYAEKYPARITFEVNANRLGPAGNFSALLSESTAPYVMCCDQDDVWLPEKVATTVSAICEAERIHGREKPVLVHTDAVLVDANLRVLSASLWKQRGVHPKRAQLRNLLAQNLVTGCTLGCNRALLNRALPIPVEEAVMHDYWLALTAATFGVVIAIQQPTVLYRQHGKNAIGVRPITLAQSLRRVIKDTQLRAALLAAIGQARAFADRFANELSYEQKAELTAFQLLFQKGHILRRWMILRYGLLRTGFWNNVRYLVRV